MRQEKGFWKKRILVPFWIVRICILLAIIAVTAITLRQLDSFNITKPGVGYDGTGTHTHPHVLTASSSVVFFMILMVIVLLIDVLNIVLFLRDALQPASFLITTSFQSGFFGGILILEIVSIGRGANPVGLIFSIIAFLSFFGLQVYAIIKYRRAKAAAQRGHYAPAHNPTTNPYATPYAGEPDHNLQSTAYHSQTYPPVATHGASDDYYQQPMKPAHIA
ncbi:hypothetical protein yc1106_08698 [Curvularia clavata]|uniref:Uncharacterized protein n=1 Tax=Curvularia clavata TaxID=95742 RepID=A0A9Q8ZH74_CURCL|nr:hypothetical protein yc1106_08698 [Curvularia clavata]